MKAETVALMGRRALATFVAAMMVSSVMFLLADPVEAASVAPEFISGASNTDKTCAANEGAGQSWIELKQDPPGNGPLSDGTLTVTVTNFTSNSFDWSSNIGVDAVIVKTGSDGANLYRYDPPAESTGDTGLITPGTNGISHISFCYDQPDDTTTTTQPDDTTTTTQPDDTTTTTQPDDTTTTTQPDDTTTTTQPDSTTTTLDIGGSTVTTAPEDTTTTVNILDSTIVNDSTTSSIEDEVLGTEVLPFTGSDNDMLALLAAGLGLLGVLVLLSTRRMEDN